MEGSEDIGADPVMPGPERAGDDAAGRATGPRRSVALLVVLGLLAAGAFVTWRTGDGEPEDAAGAADDPPAAAATPNGPRLAYEWPVERRLREEFGLDDLSAADFSVRELGFPVIADAFAAYVDEEWNVDPAVVELFGDRTFEVVPGETFVELAGTTETVVRGMPLHHRRVRDLDTGIDDAAGQRITETLRRASDASTFFDYPGTRETFPHTADVLADALESGRPDIVTGVYTFEEVFPIACGAPDRDLRCYVVSRYVVNAGGFDSIAGQVLVFDRATGDLIPRGDLYRGLTEAEGDRLIELLLRDEYARDYLDDLGEPFFENPVQWGSIVPTPEGLAYVEMITNLRTPLSLGVGRAVLSWDRLLEAARFRALFTAEERERPIWGSSALAVDFGIERVRTGEVTAGPLPQRLIGDDFWDYVSDDGDVDPAVERLFGDRRSEVVPGEVEFERAETRSTVLGDCRLIHRTVRDVEVGVAGDAGARIAEQLRRAADPEALFDFPGSRGTYSNPTELLGRYCGEATAAGVSTFYHVDEVIPIACGLPERQLRCYSVSRFSAGVGGSVTLIGYVLVFDAQTGRFLSRGARHLGLTGAEADRLIELVARKVDLGRNPFDPPPESVPRPTSFGSLVPTVDGLAYIEMVWGFGTPIGLQVGQVVVSWDVVRRASEHRGELQPWDRGSPRWAEDAVDADV